METGEKFPIKIVLLGDSHVGKTSIVNCWMSGRYDSSIKPTIGVNHQRIEMKIENEDVVLYIWDTAGQEQFQALTPLYARSACVALIIVSIIDQNSINHVQSWVELLRSSCDDIPPAVLVVNKIDLDDDAVFTREEILEKYFSSFQAVLFTSAKTGEGIMELFDQMTKLGYHFAKKGLRHADSAPVKDVKEKGICKC
ncbi:small GTP-binding protein [Histomonas meleagridis]|uniref:small GTP-binding protein n=1 Tax=Histomonas meleagridis TaxID=135588 RepID=UPI003559458E|nr:small GTP-binding protein [Histomonas meleagridis]KAH0804127.1 small GTP-binding protein [Histomonas meleagridis]